MADGGLRIRDLKPRERRIGWLGRNPILLRWNARDGAELEISTRVISLPDLTKKEFEKMSRTEAVFRWRHMGKAPGDES